MTGASGFTERAFNAALGVSLLAWTFRRVFENLAAPEAAAHAGWTSFYTVELMLSVFTGLVAVLLIFRSPVAREADWFAVTVALPAVGIGAVAFHLVQPSAWSVASVALLATGELLAASSFVCLGQSFAVLPSLRRIVTKGPYRWLRHPAYAGELIMLAACAVAQESRMLLSLWIVAVALMVPRILAEERLLSSTEHYTSYRKRVRFRLVPGVW